MSTDSTPGLWTNKGQLSFFFWGGGCCKCTSGGGLCRILPGNCMVCALCNIGLHQPFPVPGPHPDPHQTCFAISPKPNPKKTFTPRFFPLLHLGVFTPQKRGVKFTPQKRGVWADREVMHQIAMWFVNFLQKQVNRGI